MTRGPKLRQINFNTVYRGHNFTYELSRKDKKIKLKYNFQYVVYSTNIIARNAVKECDIRLKVPFDAHNARVRYLSSFNI